MVPHQEAAGRQPVSTQHTHGFPAERAGVAGHTGPDSASSAPDIRAHAAAEAPTTDEAVAATSTADILLCDDGEHPEPGQQHREQASQHWAFLRKWLDVLRNIRWLRHQIKPVTQKTCVAQPFTQKSIEERWQCWKEISDDVREAGLPDWTEQLLHIENTIDAFSGRLLGPLQNNDGNANGS
jgi:hypothetical protein